VRVIEIIQSAKQKKAKFLLQKATHGTVIFLKNYNDAKVDR